MCIYFLIYARTAYIKVHCKDSSFKCQTPPWPIAPAKQAPYIAHFSTSAFMHLSSPVSPFPTNTFLMNYRPGKTHSL